MKSSIQQLTGRASGPAHSRMITELREAIRNGTLADDSRLPTEQELAGHYGISVTSVRRGVNLLIGERLVVRKQGSGTYVLPSRDVHRPTGARDTVALAMPLELCVYHPFFSEVFKGIRRQIASLGWKLHDIHFHTGDSGIPHDIGSLPSDPETVLHEFLGNSDIAGGIFGADLYNALAPRLPEGLAAVATDATDKCPYVAYDWAYETLRGIGILERMGAKRVWVCNGAFAGNKPPDRAADRVELVCHNRRKHTPLLLSEVTRDAYDATLAALGKGHRFDGVLVGDDFSAQGVLDALSRLGLKVPGQVKVVAMINRTSRLNMSIPVTTLVADGYQKGVALADLLNARLLSPATAPGYVEMSCCVEHR